MRSARAAPRDALARGRPRRPAVRHAWASPTPGRRWNSLSVEALGVRVSIRYAEAWARPLLHAHYGYLCSPLDRADLAYTLARWNGGFVLAADGRAVATADDPGELLLQLDQDLVVQLQRRRPDLYVVHAAVLELAGEAVLLIAPSGGGKSTAAWGLVHHGLRYLSDELAPIDLRTGRVHPYPRALTLKWVPPAPYPLPARTLATSRGFHVPTRAMPGGVCARAARVSALLFLHYAPQGPGPTVQRIGAARAGAQLYANTLNALAHPGDGLDGALQIAVRAACFDVSTADLAATCAAVHGTLAALRRDGARASRWEIQADGRRTRRATDRA